MPLHATAQTLECSDEQRLAGLVKAEFGFVWRLLRRLGLAPGDADDAAQQVFLVASRRLSDIPSGAERPFLFGTALHVAGKARRARARRREVAIDALEEQCDPIPSLEVLVDRHRARVLLDRLLEEMPLELRVVFVLYEVEELTMAEIARMLELAPGTVASRLRRAREDFGARVARLEARMQFRGGER